MCLQVAAAYRCAVVLRDLISPYLLRRRKVDVATQLPPKTEQVSRPPVAAARLHPQRPCAMRPKQPFLLQVLFCSLTAHQRDLYRAYLSSGEVEAILSGKRQVSSSVTRLPGLTWAFRGQSHAPFAIVYFTECAHSCPPGSQALAGIDILRKLCNHPDLLERVTMQGTSDYGNPGRCVLPRLFPSRCMQWSGDMSALRHG